MTAMDNYDPKGTGLGSYPVDTVPFGLPPRWFRPAVVQLINGHLWAPPSTEPVIAPPIGAWRNFVDMDPGDLAQIEAVARRYGPLTDRGVAKGGEDLAIWCDLIETLSELASAWRDDGAVAGAIATSFAEMTAMELQAALVKQHQAQGGVFISAGSSGIGLIPTDMAQWWTLSALNAVWRGAPLRRCRFCNCWFSLLGQRGDNGFCTQQHRTAFHRKSRPSSQLWAEMV
jgi:hypothetical protein